MQREELLKTLMDIYKKEESIIRSIRYMKTNRPELYKEIRNHTSHLPDDTNAAELFYNLYHDIHTIQICKTPGCGKKVNLVGFFKGYSDHCCKGCTTKDPEMKRKSQESCMKKFGTKSAMQNQSVKDKGRQTTRDKYGVDHIRQSKEFKDKYEQTCLEKYGVKNPNSLQSLKDKKKKTFMERYGVECSFQSPEVKQKIYDANIKKFLVKFNTFLDNVNLEFLDDKYVDERYLHSFKCKKCGTEFKQIWNSVQQGYKCPKCFPRQMGSSIIEKEIAYFIKEDLGLEILENTKSIISPLELDIFIPSMNIAIEHDGVYWHNCEMVDKNYHINKTNMCEEKGIRLIHIFEDEWAYKKDIVKNRLKQILNYKQDRKIIHARKCVIKEITPKQKSEFLEKYHIQGNDNSVIKLGAYYENELISVMTFAHSSIAKGGSKIKDNTVWELNRFCTKEDYICTGIASKLLKHFQRHYEWRQIFSYADRRWSQGDVYEKLGFTFVKNTDINYWYTKGNDRIHRFALRKQENEDKSKTEFELRSEQGYTRIYDCGSKKYIMINTDYKPDNQLTF